MPPSTNQRGVSPSAGVDTMLGTKIDELHTVAALLAGALAVSEPGSQVEIRGLRGRLKAITPIQTVVEGETETIAVANSTFLEETIKG